MLGELGFYTENHIDWEMLWSPYDERTYSFVIEQIQPEDIVLDIGAGDLRLAQRIASVVQKVYAIEIANRLIPSSLTHENLVVITADARYTPFPEDVTVGVLLMRHCQHYRLYAEKLRTVGAARLITNARWRLGVEVVDLQQGRMKFRELDLGWYACWCGQVGFKAGPPSQLTPEIDRIVNEVDDCPHCHMTGD